MKCTLKKQIVKMKSSKKATSILEAMIVMLIVVSWVVWMYTVFNESQQLSNTSANKIQAIQIAREWIEAVKNIRDTNWVLYWSDTKNCWNVADYKSNCVWSNNVTNDIRNITNRWYTLYQNTNNRWKLVRRDNTWGFTTSWYRNRFKVWYDSNWFYTQSWALIDSAKPLKPLFTREIKINYIDTDGIWWTTSNDEKMQVTSLVQWIDNASTKPHKVEFTTILTNWKK